MTFWPSSVISRAPARPGAAPRARMSADRPALLGAAGVGHDAEGAELVAAFLDGQERATPPVAGMPAAAGRTCSRPGNRCRPRPRRSRAPARQQLGQAMIGLRADDDVDERRALDQQLALGLGDAAGDRQQHVARRPLAPRVAQPAQPAELGKDLLRGLLADVAGVQDDQIGIVGPRPRPIAVSCQRLRHTIGIVDVHLAAVGLDEEFLGHVAASAAHARSTWGTTGAFKRSSSLGIRQRRRQAAPSSRRHPHGLT